LTASFRVPGWALLQSLSYLTDIVDVLDDLAEIAHVKTIGRSRGISVGIAAGVARHSVRIQPDHRSSGRPLKNGCVPYPRQNSISASSSDPTQIALRSGHDMVI
jgi:hypothetical protein